MRKNELGLLGLAVVCLASVLALQGAAQAAAPVGSYWTCKAVIHPHAHLGEPSKGHARRHRCKRVVVDPANPAPERQVGPRPETALEAHYRTRAQAAERRIQELGRELHAANSRTEQVREDTEAAVHRGYEPLVTEVLELRSWTNQLERLARYLLQPEFALDDTVRAVILNVMCEERWAGQFICQ